MDIKTAIEKAGGATAISKACKSRGMSVSTARICNWQARGNLPVTEWTGETSVAAVICDLIKAIGNEHVHPLDICPGAGQYMNDDREAA